MTPYPSKKGRGSVNLNAYLKPMGVSILGARLRAKNDGWAFGREAKWPWRTRPAQEGLFGPLRPGEGPPFCRGGTIPRGGGVFPPLIRMLEPQERVLVGMRVPWLGSFEAKEDFRARKQSPPERRGI